MHQAGAEGQQLEARGSGGNREICNPAKGSAKLWQRPSALFPPPPPKTSGGTGPELLGAHGEHGLPYRCLHRSFLFPFLSHNWKCQAVNTPHSRVTKPFIWTRSRNPFLIFKQNPSEKEHRLSFQNMLALAVCSIRHNSAEKHHQSATPSGIFRFPYQKISRNAAQGEHPGHRFLPSARHVAGWFVYNVEKSPEGVWKEAKLQTAELPKRESPPRIVIFFTTSKRRGRGRQLVRGSEVPPGMLM